MTLFQRALIALSAVLLVGSLAAPAGAVVGGRLASEPYPHMAALYVDGSFYCGASLVAPEWILSAAHCLDGVKASEAEFLLGTTRRSSGGERIGATEIIVHESYGEPTDISHDVALARLERPATQTPIALADPQTQKHLWSAGQQARVTGWGSQGAIVDASDDLREVDVPMVSDETCARSYSGATGEFEARTMVCAGELYGTKDACYGDSGGPLTVRDESGRFVQVGVVSWGFLCGMPTQYGVYARVADTTLHDWITSRIGGGGGGGGGGTTTPGSISGRVTEQKGKAALAAATVDCGAAGTTTTADDGTYALGDVVAGSYACTASKAGYVSRTRNVTVSSGDLTTANFQLRAG